MFPSKARPLNIPQFEHARLAAWLARCWGNSEFPHPPIEPARLMQGVLMHDRGYGFMDNSPLREITEEAWQEIMVSGFQENSDDLLVDHIVRLHIGRLTGDTSMQAEPPADLPWDQIDAVTNLCDRLSLEFCFETPSRKQVSLLGVTFTYGLARRGHLFCSPWPFNAECVSGMILGYAREHYPHKLDPVVLEFVVTSSPDGANVVVTQGESSALAGLRNSPAGQTDASNDAPNRDETGAQRQYGARGQSSNHGRRND